MESHVLGSQSGANIGGGRDSADVSARDARVREWMEDVAKGDRDAFEELYRAWFDRVLGMARGISGWDEGRAMDVVQDAMMRLIDRPPRVEFEAQLAVWMRRAVLSCVIDRERRQRRAVARERSVAERGGADEVKDAAQSAADAERLAWLETQLAEMPVGDRAILRMRFAEERSLKETGAAAGVSGDAAHGRIRRVIAVLRAKAKEMFP